MDRRLAGVSGPFTSVPSFRESHEEEVATE